MPTITPGSDEHVAHLLARLAVSPSEAAEVTGTSLSTIRRAIAAGELPAKKLGRRVLIPTDALRALVGGDAT